MIRRGQAGIRRHQAGIRWGKAGSDRVRQDQVGSGGTRPDQSVLTAARLVLHPALLDDQRVALEQSRLGVRVGLGQRVAQTQHRLLHPVLEQHVRDQVPHRLLRVADQLQRQNTVSDEQVN